MGHYPKYIEVKWLIYIDEDELKEWQKIHNDNYIKYFWSKEADIKIWWNIWEAYDCNWNRWIWYIEKIADADIDKWYEFFQIWEIEQNQIAIDIWRITWIMVDPKDIVRIRYTYWW